MKRKYNQEIKETRRDHILRRGLSFGLAILTAITTLWVPELGGIAEAEAAMASFTDGTDGKESTSGMTVDEIFQVPYSGYYYSINDITAKVLLMDDDVIYPYQVFLYRNLGNGNTSSLTTNKRISLKWSSPSNGVQRNDSTDGITDVQITGITDTSGNTVYVAAGEYYAIRIVFTTDEDSEYGLYYTSSTDSTSIRSRVQGEDAEDGKGFFTVGRTSYSGEPNDITLSAKYSDVVVDYQDSNGANTTLALDDYFTVSPDGLDRTITYSIASSDSSYVSISRSTLTVNNYPASRRSIPVTASHGTYGEEGYSSASFNLYIVNVGLNDTGYDYTYSGSAKEVPLSIAGMDTGDYEITYANTTDAGTATVTISGETGTVFENYEKVISYTIDPYDIDSLSYPTTSTVTVNASGTPTIQSFTGIGGESMDENEEYEVSTSPVSQTDSSATYDVILTGKGNYTGTKTVRVSTTYANDNTVDITSIYTFALKSSSQYLTYTGSQIALTYANLDITRKYESYALTDAEIQALFTSGKLTIENGTNTTSTEGGKVKISGVASQGYSGEVNLSFGILQNNIVANYNSSRTYTAGNIFISMDDTNTISNVVNNGGIVGTATLDKSYVHTGNAITPAFKLELCQSSSGTTYTLVENTDYTVTLSSSVGAVGNQTVTIEGINNFYGSWTFSYTIIGDFATELSIITRNDATTLLGTATYSSSTGVYASAYEKTYTGSEIKPGFTMNGSLAPNFTVKLGSKTLTTDDYDIAYSDNINAGTATVTLTGKGIYAANSASVVNPVQKTAKITFTINKATLDENAVVSIANSTYSYIGSGIAVLPEQSDVKLYAVSGGDEIPNSQYTFTAANNTTVGTKTLTVTMNSNATNYTGTATGTYEITQLDISDSSVDVEYVSSWSVTGSAIEPTVKLIHTYNTNQKVELSASDYDVTYSNNVAVSDNGAVITITGKNNLKNTTTRNFSITKKDFSNLSIYFNGATVYQGENLVGATTRRTYLSNYTATYTGKNITTSNYTISDNGTTLTNETDYQVRFANNKNVHYNSNGSVDSYAKMFIDGIGDYEGAYAVVYFRINPKNLSECTVAAASTTASGTEPTVTVSFSSGLTGTTTLTKDSDYTVTTNNNDTNWPTAAGTHTGVVTGTGNYTGSVEFDYTIGTNLANATVSLVNPWTSGVTYTANSAGVYQVPYLGDAKTPNVILKDSDNNTIADTNYTVTYETSAGSTTISDLTPSGTTVKVTITATEGNAAYFGTNTSITYKVNPVTLAWGTVTTNKSNISSSCPIYVADPNSESDTQLQYYYDGTVKTPQIKLYYYPSTVVGTGDPIVLTENTDYTYDITTAESGRLNAGSTIQYNLAGAGTNFTGTVPYMDAEILARPLYTMSAYSGTNLIADKASYAESPDAATFAAAADADKTKSGASTYQVDYNNTSATIDNLRLELNGNYIASTGNYTVAYANNSAPGTATVTLTGGSNYTGKLVLTFAINHLNLGSATVSDITSTYTYNGQEHAPTPTVTFDGTVLTDGTDYTISYEYTSGAAITVPDTGRPVLPGSYYVVISPTSTGNFAGSTPIKKAFKIVGNIAKESLFSPNAYLGTAGNSSSPETFAMTITSTGSMQSTELENAIANYVITREAATGASNDTDTALTSDDYTVSYTLPNKPGTIIVQVKGKGNYTGTLEYTVKLQGSLNDAQIVFDSDYYPYTGASYQPTITVKYNGQTLSRGTDYLVQYTTDNSGDYNVGEKTLRIEAGTSGLYVDDGNATASYFIKYNLNNATVTLATTESYYYDGNEKKPNLNVSVSNYDISSFKDTYYTVSYSNNVNVGTATATVTAINSSTSYAYGSKQIQFPISAINMDGSNVAITWSFDGSTIDLDTTQFTYTGEQICPTPTVNVTVNGVTTPLDNTNYTVTYANNINVGTATVTIQGQSPYAGTVTKSFTISAMNVSTGYTNHSINITTPTVYYGGNNLFSTPDITMTYRNKEMVKGTDYNLVGSNTITTSGGVMKGNITIEGIGNFTGTITNYEVTVLPRDIGTDGSVTVTPTESVYTGADIEPNITVSVKVSDTITYVLTEGVEYTKQIQKKDGGGSVIHDVGEYYITITAKDPDTTHYTGVAQVTYTVTKRDIANTTITKTNLNETYTGSAVTPTDIVVTDTINGVATELTLGTDYTLSYENNTAAASKDSDNAPTVIITGIGNYQGLSEVTFNLGTKIDTSIVNVLADPTSYVYDGTEKKPSVSVVDRSGNGYTFTEKTATNATGNYTVSYVGGGTTVDGVTTYDGDLIHSGVKYVTVQGTNGYYGTAVGTYTITKKVANPSKMKVVPELDYDGTDYYTVYDGNLATPNAKVYDTEISETVPIDSKYYTLSYENNSDVGEAIIVVNFSGDYEVNSTDSVTQKFKIIGQSLEEVGYSASLTDTTIVPDADNLLSSMAYYPYSGSAIRPSVAFTYGNDDLTLTSGTDYTVSYVEAYVNSDGDLVPKYEEDADGNAQLVPVGADGPVNAGGYAAIVTGTGNYRGTWILPYVIYEDLDNATVTIDTQFFAGLGVSPNPTITASAGGNDLTERTTDNPEGEFVRTETSSSNYQTDGIVVIHSVSPFYTGTKTVTYQITSDGSLLTSDWEGETYVYNGEKQGTNLQIKLPNGDLIYNGADATSYPNVTVTFTEVDTEGNEITDSSRIAVDAGTVTATLTGLSSSGITGLEKTVTYKIEPRNMWEAHYADDLTIQITNSRIYDGEAQNVHPILRYKGDLLTENTDYTMTTTDNIYPGTAYISIVGKGNFVTADENPLTTNYTIKPAKVYNLDATAASPTAVNLTWNYSNNVSGYEIYQMDADGVTGTVVGSTTSNNYQVSGLTTGTTYQFGVRSYVIGPDGTNYAQMGDIALISAMTNIVAPSSSDVTATSNNTRNVTFSWSTSANVDGYAVYRAASRDGNYVLRACVPLPTGGFSDTTVTSGVTYYYKVRGYRSDGNGGWIYGDYSSIIQVTAK